MRTVQISNRAVFDSILATAMAIHPVVHDNGNQVVLAIHGGTETYARQSMQIERNVV